MVIIFTELFMPQHTEKLCKLSRKPEEKKEKNKTVAAVTDLQPVFQLTATRKV